jgi:hypothetical protein
VWSLGSKLVDDTSLARFTVTACRSFKVRFRFLYDNLSRMIGLQRFLRNYALQRQVALARSVEAVLV